MFAATGMRLSELAALQVDDVNLDQELATITRGKGDTPRLVAFDATAPEREAWPLPPEETAQIFTKLNLDALDSSAAEEGS